MTSGLRCDYFAGVPCQVETRTHNKACQWNYLQLFILVNMALAAAWVPTDYWCIQRILSEWPSLELSFLKTHESSEESSLACTSLGMLRGTTDTVEDPNTPGSVTLVHVFRGIRYTQDPPVGERRFSPSRLAATSWKVQLPWQSMYLIVLVYRSTESLYQRHSIMWTCSSDVLYWLFPFNILTISRIIWPLSFSWLLTFLFSDLFRLWYAHVPIYAVVIVDHLIHDNTIEELTRLGVLWKGAAPMQCGTATPMISY